jgi:ABC-2 type transport system permease protein
VRKSLVVAAAEFNQAVRSRAFLVSLVLMPVLMGGSIVVQRASAGHTDLTPRRFAMIDNDSALCRAVIARTEARNSLVLGKQAQFSGECIPAEGNFDELRLALSDRVRSGDLFAFVELDPGEGDRPIALAYHSDDSTYDDLREWLAMSASDALREQRLRAIGADPEVIAKLTAPVRALDIGLWTRGPGGTIEAARPVDQVRTRIVPLILVMMIFMVVVITSPQLLYSVLEEKMSRISEVLLGSLTPFELMLGKLLGSVGVNFVLVGVYLGGALGVAAYLGYGSLVPPELFAWLFLYLLMAVFLFGSMFIAVGAACSELKDAQSLMTPVMLVTMLPIMVVSVVLRAPNSPLSIGLSLFPTASPFLMLLRLAMHPPPPLWQTALSVALTLATSILGVWAAGKIFRVGVLAQGKTPTFREMLRWILVK